MEEAYWSDGERSVYHGDCLPILRRMERESVSLVCTDPPYGWGFMGKRWDDGLADPRALRQCLRLLKPGGFAFVFCGPRLDGLWRMGRMLEREGFDVSFSPIFWLYLSGFPKGKDVSKEIDKAAGAEREVVGKSATCWGPSKKRGGAGFDSHIGNEKAPLPDVTAPATPLAAKWDGWKGGRQALKPAMECVLVARKPLSERNIMENVVKHGTGAFNMGAGMVPFQCDGDGEWTSTDSSRVRLQALGYGFKDVPSPRYSNAGRHPANVAVTGGALGPRTKYFDVEKWASEHVTHLEDGSAVAYCEKASKGEKEAGLEGMEARERSRNIGQAGYARRCNACGLKQLHRGDPVCTKCGSEDVEPYYAARPTTRRHPTCKPLALVAWLLTLGNPPDGLVLDPYLGSGTTLVAAKALGMRGVGIELNNTEDEPYCEIAARRIEAAGKPREFLEAEAAGQMALELEVAAG